MWPFASSRPAGEQARACEPDGSPRGLQPHLTSDRHCKAFVLLCLKQATWSRPHSRVTRGCDQREAEIRGLIRNRLAGLHVSSVPSQHSARHTLDAQLTRSSSQQVVSRLPDAFARSFIHSFTCLFDRYLLSSYSVLGLCWGPGGDQEGPGLLGTSQSSGGK